MGRAVQGLRAWRNSLSCLTYLIENTRGATVIGILGFILGLTAIVFMGLVIGSVVRGSVVSVASVVSDYYAELVALMAMLAVLMIAYLTAFIAGFRGLANALPMLVEELRGGAQPEVEVPLCLVEYFGGRATEVLGRLYSRLLANTSVAMYFLVFACVDLVLLLVIGPPSSLKEPLLTENVPAVLRTSVDVALGVLGVITTVVLLPRLPTHW